MKICRLLEVSLECLFLVGPKVVDLPLDLLAVLSCGMLCRKLKPVMGKKVDRLWSAYLADSDADGKADIEQTLELLALKQLGVDYNADRSPFPPPTREFAGGGDIQIGTVSYADKQMYPFYLKSLRLKEHILIAGRAGSGNPDCVVAVLRLPRRRL